MRVSLIEELQKQNKLSEFFSYWNKRGPVSIPEEKQVIEDLKKLSQTLSMKEGLIMGCFDYRDLSLAFFTKNIEEISGYSTEFLESHGIAGVISALHPDDAREHVEFNNKVLEIFNGASLSEKKTFELSYTLRWLHRFTQEEIWFFTKAKPYLIDDLGNFIYDLHIGFQVTNHDHLTEYDWSFTYVKDDGDKVVFRKDDLKIEKSNLSKKELEIAKLIAKGMESLEIAEMLNISKNTVFTHRKKILKKLKAKNTAEMVKILSSLKLN
ncbi:helix-turn-helix transcriptional regulator [Mongoliibacter ruber]|uniref:Regulatory LuxR family protein n=1 Tax=Mongoliibacter ruber TaxID=1750599 RepID=A0A2T0WT93_9BACT|nr:helix-turn-helix transcriptional regulator [Mongoliibacter ruber]PRY89926.1 regulatory LuxR family protein [Mongoliibacter ruber]